MKTAIISSLLIATSFLTSPAMAQDSKATADKPAADAKPAAPAKDYTVINLDGEEIKNSDILEIWKGLFQGATAPDFATFEEPVRQNVLRGVISEKLIYKEAVKAGVDKNEDVKKRIENLRKQIIMQSFIENKAKSLVTDDKIKAAYDEKVAESKGQEEVKAKHILVAGEDEAKKIYDELKKGADFEKIAQEKSTDKGSGANGGELGWFSKDKMVPEFADAAFKLKKGEISHPVKTAFGWHIIKLEDRRPLKPATFEESKEAIRAELTNKAVQDYVESLLKSASIKYYDANGKEKEFSRTLLQPRNSEAKPEDSAPQATPAEKPAEKK
jgi:peptidyl-prolyl cis-trans isomerase C